MTPIDPPVFGGNALGLWKTVALVVRRVNALAKLKVTGGTFTLTDDNATLKIGDGTSGAASYTVSQKDYLQIVSEGTLCYLNLVTHVVTLTLPPDGLVLNGPAYTDPTVP